MNTSLFTTWAPSVSTVSLKSYLSELDMRLSCRQVLLLQLWDVRTILKIPTESAVATH